MNFLKQANNTETPVSQPRPKTYDSPSSQAIDQTVNSPMKVNRREIEALFLDGFDTHEIAQHLYLREPTVYNILAARPFQVWEKDDG